MRKRFLHCLRIQFYPNHYEDERIAEVADYCVRYGFDNVMLFINAEEYNVGHMTKEEAKPWIATMKKAKAELEKRGVSVSLNPWMELGHLDRCRPLKEGQNFTTQTDYDGNRCEMVACPLCENWKKYFLDFYRYIIEELQPNTVWVEDDFRLHNHGDLQFGGCFCELHMQRYNARLGTQYTREEFTDRLFRKKPEKRVKKAWLDVNRACMTSLAEEIGQTVSSLGLGTRVGLMSSMHDRHALEGRDWHGLHKGFAAGGVMVDRLHLPCYHEISGKNYYLEFNRYPFHCRALLPRGTVVYPELENGSFGTYTKEARFLRFQLESALPLCIEGMTYDIYDFVGNGVIESFGYGEAVKEITPYLNGVMQLRLRYEQLSGVVLPLDEKTAYKRNVPVHRFSDLVPDETAFNAYLTSVGVSCTVSTKKRFHGQIVALGGGNAYNFTKKQLRDLFAENFVVLEGGAARILMDRGLGELFGAVGYQAYVGEHNVQSYEEVKPPMEIHGKMGYRATAFGKAGDYVKIDYIDESGVQSFVYDYLGNKIGAGATCVRGCFVIPYVVDGLKYEQYNDLRTSLLRTFLRRTGVRLVCSVHAGVYAYLYEQRGRRIVLVVNSTEEDFEELKIELQCVPFASVQVVDRKDGRLKSAPFRFDGNKLCIACKNEHLTTSTIVLR